MASTTFVDQQTVITASWLNDVNTTVYTTIPSYGTMVTQNANNVAITGGAINGTTIGGTTPAAVIGTTVNGTTITASTQFSGPGTGLTGTAAGLSVGGSSASATTVTGTIGSSVTGTTQTLGTNNTTIATTAFVQNAIAAIPTAQTWHDVTASRAVGVTYTNSSSAIIKANVTLNIQANSAAKGTVGGVDIEYASLGSASILNTTMHLEIPAGATYSVTQLAGSATLVYWRELY